MGCVEMWSTAFSVHVTLASLECSVTSVTVWEWTVVEMVSVQCVCVCVCVCSGTSVQRNSSYCDNIKAFKLIAGQYLLQVNHITLY